MFTGQLHAFSIHLHFDPSEHNGSWLIVMLLLLSLSCSDKQSRIGVCPSQDTYNEHSLLSRMHEYLNCTYALNIESATLEVKALLSVHVASKLKSGHNIR